MINRNRPSSGLIRERMGIRCNTTDNYITDARYVYIGHIDHRLDSMNPGRDIQSSGERITE